MSIISFKWIFDRLTNFGFEKVKEKIAKNKYYFVSEDETPLAYSFFEVLCDDNVRKMIDHKQMENIMESIIPDEYLAFSWLDKFGELLRSAFGGINTYLIEGSRAYKYYESLFDDLIPEMQENVLNDGDYSNYFEQLIVIYKVLAALNYHVDYDVLFSLELNRQAFSNLEKQIVDYQEQSNDYTFDERAYTLIMCWLLEEKICEEDCIEGDDE